jgi:hypothetical protein
MSDPATFDRQLRQQVYTVTMRDGAPPSRAQLAEILHAGVDDISEGLRRLADAHMLVLQPGADEILMAGPFSAVPTPFRVTLRDFSCYGNCIWDALGIAATMRQDAQIDTSCGDCGTAAQLLVRSGVVEGSGFIHFALPPRTWWQNVVFT